jgi:hypothetical protein
MENPALEAGVWAEWCVSLHKAEATLGAILA